MISHSEISEVIAWVTFVFPSLSEYIKIIAPLVFVIISFIGVFSNILPEPGKIYLVPRIDDLDSELKDESKIIYRLTRLSRCITININRVIKSRPYYYFYKTTKVCANVINHIKGHEVKTKSESIKITTPEPYQLNFDLPSSNDNDETDKVNEDGGR